MYEDVLEFEDGSVEFVVFAEPYEEWRYYVADLRRAVFHWDDTPNCLGQDMHPTRISYQAQLTKTVCAGCPVQAECLYLSLVAQEEFGVWGGTTSKERKNIIAELTAALGKYDQWWNPKFEKSIKDRVQEILTAKNSSFAESTNSG